MTDEHASIGTGSEQMLRLGPYHSEIDRSIQSCVSDDTEARILAKDPTLWPGDTGAHSLISNRLGWLDLPRRMPHRLDQMYRFAQEARETGFSHIVHLGMGGSSLTPLVLSQALAGRAAPWLTVLDTTDPSTIRRLEREIPLAHTLFIAASKSGTTAETSALQRYFFQRLQGAHDDAGSYFVAITDPDTPLARLSHDCGFWRSFLNFPDVGGRYSALSYFGLLPAALAGIDVGTLLDRAAVALYPNAGLSAAVALGATLGELARRGRDKLTLLLSPRISFFGMWLEQLIAESTGKDGTGILPVADEPVADAEAYGSDRVFVHISLSGTTDGESPLLESLERAGHPVVRLRLADEMELGHQLLHWQLATAVAGSVLEINPFDEPNVAESKQNTGRLLDQLEHNGKLPEDTPSLDEPPLRFYGGQPADTSTAFLRRFLGQARPGDYFALQVYLPEGPTTHQALQSLRSRVRDKLGLATTLGYGPRYLHSTGQLHKGGTATGLFLQVTGDDPEDMPVPSTCYTFGQFKRAQAIGDLQALWRHGRRAVRVHLSGDTTEALSALQQAVQQALA
ncbi:MAG: hypothetical protein ACOC6A_01705 [Chloroflexota bacterium]